jgi:hypothetical protein
MRSFVRFHVGSLAAISAAVAVAATAGPALAFPAPRHANAVAAVRQASANTNMHDFLDSVSASSASNAWAVGGYQVIGGAHVAMTEHWNGTKWKLVPTPGVGGGRTLLFGVAARPSQALTVGRYWDGAAFQTLSELWNGTAWKRVPSPSPGGIKTASLLQDVAYYSRSRAWAVGYYATGGSQQALIERWNGTAWHIVPSPAVTGSYLEAISAVSPSNAWAVGDFSPGPAKSQTLIEHWNGISWSTVPSPDPSTTTQNLVSVSAVSPSDAWAVGYYSGTGNIQTLILHWNGSSWKQVSSPDLGGATNYNVLNGVTATSSGAWAEGYYSHDSVFQTLIVHWNGTSWKHVASPNVGTSSSYLSGVGMTPKSPPWAVGEYIGNTGTLTLTERWNGSRWRVVASPSK